ncbi:MAG: hypothetical protein II794_02140 [Oscillospiraceae bacterium]|nr:hypothetical protein [Oscillospiraceae bacterium]
MSIVLAVAFFAMTFAVARRRGTSPIEEAPWLLCALGLLQYVLAFFGAMSRSDIFLLLGGTAALVLTARWALRRGTKKLLLELRRQLLDPFFIVSLALIITALVLLRQERILEWDGYNFWGPDVKSLFFRDGFAPRYSNPAVNYGNYTPFVQITWWQVLHLAGEYNERYLFWGYYLFGALTLLSVAARFRDRGPVAGAVAALCAVILPGVMCTTWYRALTVDPIMAFLFGAVLCEIAFGAKNEEDKNWHRCRLFTMTAALVLTKSIGILWGVLAALFALLWRDKDGKLQPRLAVTTLGFAAVPAFSWIIYCRLMDRAGYLTGAFGPQLRARLSELMSGTFLSSGNTAGFIKSYIQAFFLTPVHRESTPAIDLSPFAGAVIILAGALLLWKLGFVTKKQGKALFFFSLGALVLIYLVVSIGQLTMFYREEQYLDPVNAVTLMARYCSPGTIGLFMLICALTGREGPETEVKKPVRITAMCLAGVIILSCGAYNEMYRRFISDPLDPRREELRQGFEERYAAFIETAHRIPLDRKGSRIILGVYGMDMNPIVYNAASPASVDGLVLNGNLEYALWDLDYLAKADHAGYLYLRSAYEDLVSALSLKTAGGEFRVGVLYRITPDEAGGIGLLTKVDPEAEE